MSERLQKLISAAGLMSRRSAEDCIRAGRVTVNGSVAAIGDKADPETDTVLVDGRPLSSGVPKLYIALHKPKGYVTTMSDEQGRRTVTELVAELPARVYPVGRLDMYSEGLLLMTNDGDFANHMMHPSHEVTKVYRTWVQGSELEAAAELMRRPMDLEDYRTSPAQVEILRQYPDGAVLDVSIHEGRNRQVRRMCQAAGLRVTRLLRIAEGAVELGQLESGKWRSLTAEELEALRRC